MNGKINDKQKSDDRTIEEKRSEDRHLIKINSWRTAWRSLWRNFSQTKISCYTVEKYGIHWTSSSHKLDVGSNFFLPMQHVASLHGIGVRLWECKDQVLGNRHRPAVYASSRAATFSVGSIWPVTLPRPCITLVAWFAVAATLTILADTSVSSRFSFWMLAAYTTVGW